MKTRARSSIFLPFALLLFCALSQPWPASAQQTPGEANGVELARKIVNLTAQWMSGKLSTPGASVELREVSQSNKPSGVSVQYAVHVTGAPTDQTYSMMAWPVTTTDPQIQTNGLSITAAGVLVCGGHSPIQCFGRKPDDPLLLSVSPAPGEIFRFELMSDNFKTTVYFSIVPVPIIKKTHGCSLEVVRLTPHFELALLLAKGLQPNESVEFAATSYGEPQDFQGKADASGQYISALMPFAENKPKGKTSVKLKSASCTSELSFEWGK